MKQNQITTDEKTRKDLVEFVLYKAGYLLDEETEHRFVKYLEKQKEQQTDGKAMLHVAEKSYQIGLRDGRMEQNAEPFSCGHENGDSEKTRKEESK